MSVQRPDRPPWQGPPENLQPRRLAHQLVLAQTDALVLVAERFAVYSSGFGFVVRLSAQPGQRLAHFNLSLMWAGQLRDAGGGEAPPEIFRLELEFSDGARAAYAEMPRLLAPSASEPTGPVLWAGPGHAVADQSEQQYWVWPLPPPGPIAFCFAWPANGLPSTRKHLDSALILDAAAATDDL